MRQSKQFVNPNLLGEAFRRICEKGHTGVFQIITEKNEVLSFNIKDGKVVNVIYRTRENKEALWEIGFIKKGKYTFYERKKVIESFFEAEIPTKKEVLAYLLGQSNGSSPTSNLKRTVTDSTIIDPKKTLSDSTMMDLKKTLTDHIGPMSKIVCKEVFEKTADINTAINMLEKAIPDANHAKAFKKEAKHLLVVKNEEYFLDFGELDGRLEECLISRSPSN